MLIALHNHCANLLMKILLVALLDLAMYFPATESDSLVYPLSIISGLTSFLSAKSITLISHELSLDI